MINILPWIEKYRPKSLEEIVGNNDAVEKLKIILKNKNIPNMILSGPPGSGKTSSIVCIAREILGDCVNDALLELNASDERGIDTVRKSIKMFCKKQVNNLPETIHKLVLLDEADNMTPSAQQALRRIIENYADTTRFLFACNNSARLIEAIQSRCITMKFSRLSEDQIVTRLKEILDLENTTYTDTGIEALIFISDGDMRQILNNAQAIACNYQMITQENVYNICDKPHPDEIRTVILHCSKGEHVKAQDIITRVFEKGYSVIDIMDTLFKIIKKSPPDTINLHMKLGFVKEIGNTHMHVTKGMDNIIQLNALIARFCLVAITPIPESFDLTKHLEENGIGGIVDENGDEPPLDDDNKCNYDDNSDEETEPEPDDYSGEDEYYDENIYF